ncbi:MAG: sulfatase [Flavisolibacter sp.]|nr:sulfatase [Flavisolibacter sp.]
MKRSISRSLFFALIVILTSFQLQAQSGKQPNFIIIFVDDLGYGDLSCFGHPTIRTPNLDQMAAEGMRFTQFYVGANVCTPSRAALLTGRLPVRNGMYGKQQGVFFPNSASGLPHSEITMAEALKKKNYQTALVGKWHLGSTPEYLPLNHGFDYYFGIPYSGDMGKVGPTPKMKDRGMPPLPLYRNEKVIEEEPDQHLLTKRYTTEVLEFIRKNKNQPFFMYYANNFPHVPLYASKDFEGKSKRGLYGDVVEELDWSVGEILKELKKQKLDKNTFVIFTSDNGPWLMKGLLDETSGSAGLLYEGKASTYEGGMRVPAIAWWPGTIKPNQISEAVATTMDLYPTILHLAKAEVPKDRPIDGNDIIDLLTGKKDKVTDVVFYYDKGDLYAVRKGPWKAHFTTHHSYSPEPPQEHNPPLLYNIEADPSEQYDTAKDHANIVEDLKKVFEEHKRNVVKAPPEFDKVIEKKETAGPVSQ